MAVSGRSRPQSTTRSGARPTWQTANPATTGHASAAVTFSTTATGVRTHSGTAAAALAFVTSVSGGGVEGPQVRTGTAAGVLDFTAVAVNTASLSGRFAPPLRFDVPTFTDPRKMDPLALRFARHRRAGARGVNVYILKNGTVTEVDPNGDSVSWDDVAHVFYGGHQPEQVTPDEKALLQSAGYTVT